ncbi:unnamed protein product [Cyclocybe aegerita]|uniref:Pali-domain-containing protein n=1 Tax=Cyclocybe aegerita TaxID=1973307 RepID=A0A8S0VQ75_CYCAE|nr:unnamed protein product [Cyclocybe aegerita]
MAPDPTWLLAVLPSDVGEGGCLCSVPPRTMREDRKPFARYRIISILSSILLFSAFILLLLVGLSLTIIKPIYLLIFRSTVGGQPLSIATELRFGVWGVCASSQLNQPTLITNPGLCFGPRLGYDVPEYISDAVGIDHQIVETVEQALLFVLVLHPIAAGLTLFSFIFSLFLYSHAFSIFTLILTLVTALVSSVVLGIDLALVIVAKNQVENLEAFSFEVVFGNGVWMILAAVIFVWLAVMLLSARACYCLGVHPYPGEKHYNAEKHGHANRY